MPSGHPAPPHAHPPLKRHLLTASTLTRPAHVTLSCGRQQRGGVPSLRRAPLAAQARPPSATQPTPRAATRRCRRGCQCPPAVAVGVAQAAALTQRARSGAGGWVPHGAAAAAPGQEVRRVRQRARCRPLRASCPTVAVAPDAGHALLRLRTRSPGGATRARPGPRANAAGSRGCPAPTHEARRGAWPPAFVLSGPSAVIATATRAWASVGGGCSAGRERRRTRYCAQAALHVLTRTRRPPSPAHCARSRWWALGHRIAASARYDALAGGT